MIRTVSRASKEVVLPTAANGREYMPSLRVYPFASQRARVFRITFRFSQITFPCGSEQGKNSTKLFRKMVDASSGKVMRETRACFLCLTATRDWKSYLKEAKSFLINVTSHHDTKSA